MPTFGTRSNPAHYVEIPDPANPGQVIRPPAGTTLMARSHPDGTALPDIVVGDYGYWDLVADPNAITVSGDGGASWVGPLFSVESLLAAISGGLDIGTALERSYTALATAQEALAAASGGASVSWDTLDGVPATFPPSAHKHKAIDITDLADAIAAAGAGGIMVVRYTSGAYPALPASRPAGVLVVSFFGPTAPTSVPSWIGTGAGHALGEYTYASLS